MWFADSGFFDVQHPYRIEQGQGVFFGWVVPVIYIPVVVLTGSSVPKPFRGCATASFRSSRFGFRAFAFRASVSLFGFFWPAFAVISFSSWADEVLFVCVAGVGNAGNIWTVSVKDWGYSGVLFDGGLGDAGGQEVKFRLVF